MKFCARVGAGIIVFLATYFFVYWVPFSILPQASRGFAQSVSFVCALITGWFVWVSLKGARQGFIASLFVGSMILGALGFSAGFFGPLIFAPEANQGPLLGIFITGPLGFFLGGILGMLYWWIWGRKAKSISRDVTLQEL